jgi:hypothetical protein
MIMKNLALLLIVCLLVPPGILAQNSNTGWKILQQLSPSGQLILVKTRSGKSFKGQLQRVTDSALELSMDGKNVAFESAEVSRVYVLRGRQLGKGALIGAGIGIAGGATIGAIAGRGKNFIFDQKDIAAMGAAAGLALGSITGLVIGASKHKKELVYEVAPLARISKH